MLPTNGGVRVLITGATGLLGRQVLPVFESRGWDVRGLGLARASGRFVRCDLLNAFELEVQFQEFKPDIVIHCAAERRPDVLEEDRAYATKINVDLTREIGRLCKSQGAWLIYISTNYVFDGKNAPYAEDAAPCPVNTYGESKLAGEKALEEVHPDAATLRVPLLYGPIEYLGETSVTALLNTIRKKDPPPKLDNWQERFPTCVEDVAQVLEVFCSAYATRGKANPEAFRGVFHWQANTMHTKYTIALVIAEIACIDPSGFVRVDDAPAPGTAPRPQFEFMKCNRLEALLRQHGVRDVESCRCDFKAKLEEHLQPFLSPRRSLCFPYVGGATHRSSKKAAFCMSSTASFLVVLAYHLLCVRFAESPACEATSPLPLAMITGLVVFALHMAVARPIRSMVNTNRIHSTAGQARV